LRNYLRDIGDALRSSKIKVGSCQNHPTRPKTGKNEKPIKKKNASHQEFFAGKCREYGRNTNTGKYERLGKRYRKEPG
jgi:hypothetical protein